MEKDIQNCSNVSSTTSEEFFKCMWRDCTSTFKDDTELRKHLRDHCADLPPIQCEWEDCNSDVFTNRQLLSNHLLVHISDNVLKCDVPNCRTIFKKRRYLLLHRRKQHGIYSRQYGIGKYSQSILLYGDAESKIVCMWKDCNCVFKSYEEFKTHSVMHCRENLPSKCMWKDCPTKCVFSRLVFLKSHLFNHIKSNTVICSVKECGRLFSAQHYLVYHMKSNHGIDMQIDESKLASYKNFEFDKSYLNDSKYDDDSIESFSRHETNGANSDSKSVGEWQNSEIDLDTQNLHNKSKFPKIDSFKDDDVKYNFKNASMATSLKRDDEDSSYEKKFGKIYNSMITMQLNQQISQIQISLNALKTQQKNLIQSLDRYNPDISHFNYSINHIDEMISNFDENVSLQKKIKGFMNDIYKF
ncbi:hypothetical protein A3Q56_03341 [Intoshia linei]|uniref:C2H2-type domain-containing protein n=1 Tax=Intoshia linei TaxID=1819745 RepID=A0A177B539_9BILA|nr:hypothetical protein A3Q56_03341 [Intoshia linei]